MGQSAIPRQISNKRSRYHILGLVGQGQFGQVFCAVDRASGAVVALKRLDLKRLSTKTFLRELHFLISLQHPNIVSCQAIEHHQQSRYLVMDYCEGGTLRSLLETTDALAPQQALQIMIQVLEGLEYAHSRGVIHCDIKPENILLHLEPQGWLAKISDFGVARDHREPKRKTSTSSGFTGSPAYMAPERFYGQYSYSCDLYAVGVLLYEMLIGERPFSGIPSDLMAAHLNQPAPIPENLPFLCRSILATALQKLPQKRYPNATEMLKAVRLAAEVEMSQQSVPQLWSMPKIDWDSSVFSCVEQEDLAQPIEHLGVQEQRVYWVQGNQLSSRSYAEQIRRSDLRSQSQIDLAATAIALYPYPQGCFVLVQKKMPSDRALNQNYALYDLPVTPASQAIELSLPPPLWSITATELLLAIAPSRKWFATIQLNPGTQDGIPHLDLWHLPSANRIAVLPCPRPLYMLVLSQRYGLLVSEREPDGRTCLQGFTRRGTWLFSYTLPLGLSHPIANPYNDFQILGLETSDPTLGLLIDLKPWRVKRIPLGFIPEWLHPFPWGYLLANQQGQGVLLSLLGERLGYVQLPDGIRAIAPYPPYGLLIATWKASAGVLYTVDLRELNLDLIF